jgi:hypothetical protein
MGIIKWFLVATQTMFPFYSFNFAKIEQASLVPSEYHTSTRMSEHFPKLIAYPASVVLQCHKFSTNEDVVKIHFKFMC